MMRFFFTAPRLIGIGLIVCFVFTLPKLVQAAVDLVSFDPSQENDWVRLDWETASELDNAGFFVLRNTTGGTLPEEYSPIFVVDADAGGDPITYIPPRGDVIGAVYAFYDQNVSVGVTYYYLLQTVDLNNISEYYGPKPLTLTANGVSATPTTATPTSSPTITSTPTSGSPTLSPTPTSTSTVTRTPTRTPTPPPTSIPFNTVTPTRTQTPTPGPSETPTLTLTVTPTASVTLHPLDLTLTAVLAQVSPLPTYTPPEPSRTPFPTWTPIPPGTPQTVSTSFFEGANASSLLGLILIGFLVIAGGGIFTFFFFFSRENKNRSGHA